MDLLSVVMGVCRGDTLSPASLSLAALTSQYGGASPISCLQMPGDGS